MKKTALLIIACLSHVLGMAQYGTQFENRGFESWANFISNDNDTYEPVHWHSGKTATGSYAGSLPKQIEPSSQVRPGTTGSISMRMWPKTVMLLFTANGNLTNGRMNADSPSTTGSGNYNYTQRENSFFNTPINTVPDSLTVWVCFRSNNTTYEAQVRAAVHGDANFKFLANGSVDPADKLVAVATKNFNRTSTSGGSYVWRRLSVPFDHSGPCTDPRYILFTITTNKTPGEGSTSDDLFVDDILLIYNPSIQMGSLPQYSFHFGDQFNIPFVINGTMSPENLNKEPNQVIAQLSGSDGNFNTPVELGRMTTDGSGNLTVTIPDNIPEGEHYRIRLITTNYPMVSEDNGTDLSITNATTTIAENGIEEDVIGIEVYDLSGRRIPCPCNTPGIYIIKYRTANGYTVQKVLKQ